MRTITTNNNDTIIYPENIVFARNKNIIRVESQSTDKITFDFGSGMVEVRDLSYGFCEVDCSYFFGRYFSDNKFDLPQSVIGDKTVTITHDEVVTVLNFSRIYNGFLKFSDKLRADDFAEMQLLDIADYSYTLGLENDNEIYISFDGGITWIDINLADETFFTIRPQDESQEFPYVSSVLIRIGDNGQNINVSTFDSTFDSTFQKTIYSNNAPVIMLKKPDCTKGLTVRWLDHRGVLNYALLPVKEYSNKSTSENYKAISDFTELMRDFFFSEKSTQMSITAIAEDLKGDAARRYYDLYSSNNVQIYDSNNNNWYPCVVTNAAPAFNPDNYNNFSFTFLIQDNE